LLAAAGTPVVYAVLSRGLSPLFALALTPAVAGVALIAVLTRPSAPWYGYTPTLVWLARGRQRLGAAACVPPLVIGLVAAGASTVDLPLAAVPGLFLYLASALLLIASATLARSEAGRGVITGLTLLALLYGLPLVVLAVAELFPQPERTIAVALSLWPPAIAAGLLPVDLMRLPWCYANLPVSYYPYAYPTAWLSAGLLALPALLLTTVSWLGRTPPTGWRQPLWRLR
jgi:hypothetical protein